MNKNNRVGETRLMNCGMKCTIIKYFRSDNITIQFENGSIIKNKSYQSFKKGLISNPNLKEDYSKRLGETKMMKCGMKCTIVEYINAKNITVQFEDGTIIKNKTYQSFKNSVINNPNFNKYVGKTNMMNCGMKATIVEYINTKNITVKFEDGVIVMNKAYDAFKKGSIANPNLLKDYSKRLGETKMMKCGMKATIIEYINSINITVQFEDGIIIKNKVYSNFKKGEIANPNLNYFTIFKGTNKEFTGTLKEISNYFNLNYENIKIKINKYNMTIEEAIITPLIRFKQNNLIYKDEKGNMRELCKKFNKNFIEVYNKVKYNHTFEWAMDSTKTPYDWKYYN